MPPAAERGGAEQSCAAARKPMRTQGAGYATSIVKHGLYHAFSLPDSARPHAFSSSSTATVTSLAMFAALSQFSSKCPSPLWLALSVMDRMDRKGIRFA